MEVQISELVNRLNRCDDYREAFLVLAEFVDLIATSEFSNIANVAPINMFYLQCAIDRVERIEPEANSKVLR